MYFSFENEPLLLQLVTMRTRFVRCAISTFGNEHIIRLDPVYSSLVKKVSYTNGVFRIIKELNRKVNKLKKLIAKMLFYVVFIESGECIWTKNVKFSRKTKFGLGNRQTGQRVLAYQRKFPFSADPIVYFRHDTPSHAHMKLV